MPVYTVGHEESYDDGIKGLGKAFLKLGRKNDYPGGFAVCSVDDAIRLIEEQDKVGYWAVYELDADWEKDTVQSLNGWWHALINDSLILRKVFSSKEHQNASTDRAS